MLTVVALTVSECFHFDCSSMKFLNEFSRSASNGYFCCNLSDEYLINQSIGR